MPLERAQQKYEQKRRYLDPLVDAVAGMKKADGSELVEHVDDPYLGYEPEEVYRLRVLQEIEKRYREVGNPAYSVDVDPIRQAIEANHHLRDDRRSTILGLRAEQERIKGEIVTQREKKYEQDLINRGHREPPEQYIPPKDFPEITFYQVLPPR